MFDVSLVELVGKKWTYVVNDVKMRNVMQEKSALPTQNWPIHCGSSTSLRIPYTIAVMGNHRVGVM